jgi:hypothetical protein
MRAIAYAGMWRLTVTSRLRTASMHSQESKAGRGGMLRGMRLCLLVLALVITTEKSADAVCACPPRLSSDTESVPVRGSLYLDRIHWLEHGDISLRWIGTPGTATWTIDGNVARLDYSGPDGSELVIVTFGSHEHARYRLDSKWRAPSAAPRATNFTHHESSWTCASTDAIFIDVDQSTAAVRVRWTYQDTTEFRVLAREGRVAIGHVGCCGTSIPPEELHDGGELELVAIRADGSEVPILGVPSYLSSDMVRLEKPPSLEKQLEDALMAAHASSDASDTRILPPWLAPLLSIAFLVPLLYLSRRFSE